LNKKKIGSQTGQPYHVYKLPSFYRLLQAQLERYSILDATNAGNATAKREQSQLKG